MAQATFFGMVKATPNNFQFSVKVPEVIMDDKRLDPNSGALADFEEYLEKIAPLRHENKLGALLIQMPPSFSVKDFRHIEKFLDFIAEVRLCLRI